MSNPPLYNGGVNTKNNSRRETEADLQEPAVAQRVPHAGRGALHEGAECQQSGGGWSAGVLSHGCFHTGHRGARAQLGARSTGLVLWAPKAKCHLTPRPLPQPKRAGGEGVGLLRLVVVTRLEAAWALGCAWAMDMVDDMDVVDIVDARGQEDGEGSRDQKDRRLRLDQGQRVVWGAPARRRSEAMLWRFAGRDLMSAKRGRITGCEVPKGLGITRLISLDHAWSGLVTLNSGVFFWCPCGRPRWGGEK
jgi:hypothetical protein